MACVAAWAPVSNRGVVRAYLSTSRQTHSTLDPGRVSKQVGIGSTCGGIGSTRGGLRGSRLDLEHVRQRMSAGSAQGGLSVSQRGGREPAPRPCEPAFRLLELGAGAGAAEMAETATLALAEATRRALLAL